MTIPKFDQLSGSETLEDLIELVAKLQKQVQWLLDGKLGSDNIRTSSIVADRMDVGELSAITANLGHITAGLIEAVQIFGSYIATSTSYPRTEFSSSGNLVGAFLSGDQYVVINPFSLISNSPIIQFNDGSTSGDGYLYLNKNTGQLNIQSSRTIRISSGAGNIIFDTLTGAKFPDWNGIINTATNQTLQGALNSKANSFTGFTGSFTVALNGGGSRALTFSNGVLTSAV